MGNFKAIALEQIKKQFLIDKPDAEFQNTSKTREYYLKNQNDNFFLPMSAGVEGFYKKGSGNELSSGKMNALHSSSVMTYNLFWDLIAEINQGKGLGGGVYQVELEKQYRPLKNSPRPSNLDAFLYNKHTHEAIACEMKMTEWLGSNSKLREAYINPENYHANGDVFVSVANKLTAGKDWKENKNGYKEARVHFDRYDAAQMFKHAAACYAACLNGCKEKDPRPIKTLTLLNCVWTIPDLNKAWEEEEKEFNQFKQEMQPIIDLFKKSGITFVIKFLSFSEFLKMLKKTDEELRYLRRYTF